MLKRLLTSAPVQIAIAQTLAAYMRFVAATTRWERRNLEIVERIWEGGAGVVGCVWHARVLMTIAGWPRTAPQQAKVLISRSRDGDVVARTADALNVPPIRGSARNPKKGAKAKGGITAFREMMEHVEGGGCVAIAADGPRGPRMRAGMGPIKLAKATGAPIILFAWSTSNRLVFNSWDRFVLPLPFGKGVIVWRGPYHIPADADRQALEAARAMLEATLIEANQEADAATGREVIEPAPAPEPVTPEPVRVAPAGEPA